MQMSGVNSTITRPLVFENFADVDLFKEGPDDENLWYGLFYVPVHYRWHRQAGISCQMHISRKLTSSYESLTEDEANSSSWALQHLGWNWSRKRLFFHAFLTCSWIQSEAWVKAHCRAQGRARGRYQGRRMRKGRSSCLIWQGPSSRQPELRKSWERAKTPCLAY